MNIAMFTNTYSPHVGGVARSVESFCEAYRRKGHRTLVVAPEFPGIPAQETGIVRIPAIQNFNGSDFSVVLPFSGLLSSRMKDFRPDIIHAHHPYLLGVTALRIARYHQLPLIFTHHTRYEEYTHYVPGDSPRMRRFIIEMATQYANLTDRVFAPSESIRDLLRSRSVTTEIEVVPTGLVPEHFAGGDGEALRGQLDIPATGYVIGHLGRLAPEKNIAFLARAVARFISHARAAEKGSGKDVTGYFLVVGGGGCEQTIRDIFDSQGLGARLRILGTLQPAALADALAAMDIFAFASHTETQGMVLTEAMAAGLPVVALDAPGAREVLKDKENGRLLSADASWEDFAETLTWMAAQPPAQIREWRAGARHTAEAFSMDRTADKALSCYASLQSQPSPSSWSEPEERWQSSLQLIKAEWEILKATGSATSAALSHSQQPPSGKKS